MQRLHARSGYTLLELMVVVAIIGFMSMLAISALKTYVRREDTRRAARTVAGVIENARSQAVTTGRMTWVVFEEPVNGIAPWQGPTQFAAVISASNPADTQPSAGDGVQPIYLPPGPREHTSRYVPGTSPSGSTPLPDLDQSQDIPTGDLSNTVDGTTFNVDPTLGVAAVGFNSQGFPVRADGSSTFSPGAIYLTDNDSSVVSVVVSPIGAVRTLALDAASGTWK